MSHSKMKASTILTLIAVDWCFLLFGIIHGTQSEDCTEICEYSPQHMNADCSGRNLGRIPAASQCSNAHFLDFRKNSLQYLDERSLSGFENLRYIYLEENRIRSIAPGTFAACVNLKRIYLQNNPIVNIVNNTFLGLSNLERLFLNNAQLEIVEAGAFFGLNSIERLFLKNNSLRTLPRNVFHNLRTLRSLMLSNNELEYLHPEQFHGLSQLSHIEIQENRLTRLESELFRLLPRLTSLNASSNSISEIQNGAFDFDDPDILPNLERIDLSYNKIVSVYNISNVLVEIPQLFFAGNPMYCGCSNLILLKWYDRHGNSTIITNPGTEVICQGPRDYVDSAMKDVSKEIISMCNEPKPIEVPNSGNKQIDFAGVTPVGNVNTDDGQVPKESGKNQTAVALGSSYTEPKESKLYMIIGITAISSCVLVITVFGILIVRKFSNSRRPSVGNSDKDVKELAPSLQPTTRIVDNPIPEEDLSSEEDLYEPIANMQEFPPPRHSRNRLISERSTDSAFSEGSFPESEDFTPPTYPPPPPPPHQSALSGYIPFYQSENGKVFLCIRCPHSLVSDSTHPPLAHSVSVPAHCCDLANTGSLQSQRQPLLIRQHSYPERCRAATFTCANQSNDQVEIQPDGELPSYAQATKQHRSSEGDIRTQKSREPHIQSLDYVNENQRQDGPPIPLQTNTADQFQLDALGSYPSTNPFSTQRPHPENRTSSSTSPSRKVSFSNVTAVYTQDSPVCDQNPPVYTQHQLIHVQNKPVCT